MTKLNYTELKQLQADGFEHSHVLTAVIDDISTASSGWTSSVPFDYQVLGGYITIYGPITVADANITVKENGNLIDGMSAVIPFSGSAAGDTIAFSAPTDAPCVAGDALEIVSDGGSTDPVKAIVNITVMRRRS